MFSMVYITNSRFDLYKEILLKDTLEKQVAVIFLDPITLGIKKVYLFISKWNLEISSWNNNIYQTSFYAHFDSKWDLWLFIRLRFRIIKLYTVRGLRILLGTKKSQSWILMFPIVTFPVRCL